MANTSFDGLTIEIGADTRSLQRALKQMKGVVGGVDKELRRLKGLLDFDGGDLASAARRAELLGEKAGAAASNMKEVARYAAAAGKRVADGFGGKTVKQLAESTSNARTELARLTAEYNEVDRAIRTIKQDVAKANGVANAQNLTGRKLDSVIDDLRMMGKVSESAQAQLKKLADQHVRLQSQMGSMELAARYADATSEIRRQRAEVVKLSSAWASESVAYREATEGGGFAAQARQLEQLSAASKEAMANMRQLGGKATMAVLERELSAVQNRVKSLGIAVGDVRGASMEQLERSTEQAAQAASKAQSAYASMEGRITAARQRMAELAAQIARVEAAGGDSSKLSNRMSNYARYVERATTSLGSMRQAAKAADEAFAGAKMAVDMKQAEERAAQLAAQLRKVKAVGTQASKTLNGMANLRTAGYAMYNVSGMASLAASYAVQSADQIDAAYRDMRKTVNGTDEQFEALKESAIEFSRTHVTSADQILEIQAMGGQLGIAADSLGEFAKVVSNIDVATNIDADDAAVMLGKLQGVTNMSTDDFERFGDSLVRLGNNFPALESDIMEIDTRFAGVGTTVGMSNQEMLAWSTAATATGQKAEAAGSSMQRFISYMETAVTKGGSKLKAWAKVAGVTSDQLKEMWKKSPSDAMQAFVVGLDGIKKSGGSVNQTLADLGITNVRDKQLLAGLANTTDILSKALDQSADAWRDGGDAQAEADKKAQGFSGQLSKMKNNAQALASEVGESLAPALGTLADGFSDLTGWYKSLSSGQKAAINAIGAFTAAAGPMTVMIGTIGHGIGTMRRSVSDAALKMLEMGTAGSDVMRNLRGVETATELAAASQGVLGTEAEKSAKKLQRHAAMTKLGSAAMTAAKGAAVGLAVAGIALLVTKLADAYQKSQDFRTATEGMTEAAGAATGSVSDQANSLSTLYQNTGKAAQSWDDFVESQKQHAEAMQEANKTYLETSSSLNTAKAAIDRYAGVSDLTTEQQGQLKAAIERVNSACGTQYKVVDAANGKISDSAGHYDKAKAKAGEYVKQIDKLIEKKKEEARANALNSKIQEAEAAKQDAQAQYAAALKNYNDALKMDEQSGGATWQQTVKAKQALDDAAKAVDAATQSANTAYKQLGDVEAQTSKAGDALYDATWGKSEQMSQNLIANGHSLDEFMSKFQEAGVTASDFAGLTQDQLDTITSKFEGNAASLQAGFAEAIGGSDKDVQQLILTLAGAGVSFGTLRDIGSEQLKALSDACGGNVNTMVAILSGLNGIKLDPKRLKVNDDGSITYYAKKLSKLDRQKLKDKGFQVNDDGTITITKKQVDELNNDLAGSKLDKKGKITVDTSKYKQGTEDAARAAARVLSFNATVGVNAKVKQTKQAKGGIFDGKRIHRFAGGGIVNRPTPVMGGLGIAGEAGAEAIIPLDNKRYVRPFARAVASMVGGGPSTYNVSVNVQCRTDADATEIAREITRSLKRVKMNGGR